MTFSYSKVKHSSALMNGPKVEKRKLSFIYFLTCRKTRVWHRHTQKAFTPYYIIDNRIPSLELSFSSTLETHQSISQPCILSTSSKQIVRLKGICFQLSPIFPYTILTKKYFVNASGYNQDLIYVHDTQSGVQLLSLGTRELKSSKIERYIHKLFFFKFR